MRARDKRSRGLRMARDLGHRVAGWWPDVDDGDLAQCSSCDRFMAANMEEPEPWGYLTRERCTGRRMA